MKKALKISGIVLASLVVLTVSFAFMKGIVPLSFGIHDPVYTSSGYALDGYDVVSYFKGRPVKGDKLTFEWQGVTWRFASGENLEAFRANPEKFVPRFGGYCTKAVSTGFAAPGDPSSWTVWNDQLYIFTSDEVKAEFLKDPQTIIEACSEHWN